MNSRIQMPLEIILEILDSIRYDTSRTFNEQTRDLKSLSLVSRSWARYAQTVLFRDVRLYGQDGSSAFLEAVTKHPELGQSVRRLKVTVGYENPEQNYKTVLSQRELISLLAATPYLYQLDISLLVRRLYFSTTEALRQLESCRPIALRYTNLSEDESSAIYQFTELWGTSLKHLVVAGGQGSYASISPPPVALTPPITQQSPSHVSNLKLTEFQWLGLERPSNEVVDFFLGPSSVGSLKSLRFRSLPLSETFTRLLESHGSTLRSLRVSDLFGVDKTALKQCAALEEFAMERGNAGAGVVDTLRNHLVTNSLVHLDFGTPASAVKSATNKILEDLFDSSSVQLPRLRAVTQRVARLSATKGFAKPRNAPLNVQLEMKASDLDSESQYLIEPRSFPRIPTAYDFRAMNNELLQVIYAV